MILAVFATEREMLAAATDLREQQAGEVELFMPIEPEHKAGHSWVPIAILVAGMIGLVGSFLLMTYATTMNFPLDVGGRPNLSWPAYVPIAFETGVLAAVTMGFFGFLAACRLPRLYDPIDESDAIRAATRDGYVVVVRRTDAVRARRTLAAFGPVQMDETPDP
jgi:hypothetical protein